MQPGEVARSPRQGTRTFIPKQDLFTPPPSYKIPKNRQLKLNSRGGYSEESDDESDDEVAMHTRSDKPAKTPMFISSSSFHHNMQEPPRKTPGADRSERMESFKSGAFEAVPKSTPSSTLKTQTARSNGGGAINGYGIEASQTRGMPPRSKSQTKGVFQTVQTPDYRNASGTEGYRRNVNTPIGAMLMKNTNLDFQGRGSDSPSTELLTHQLHFLDEDDGTPQAKPSSKPEELVSISQASSFAEDSVGSNSDPTRSSIFTDKLSPSSKATRKSSDVNSVHSYNSEASESSKADGVRNFINEPSIDAKHLSPSRIQQQGGGSRGNHVTQNSSYHQHNPMEEYADSDSLARGQSNNAYYHPQPYEQHAMNFHPNDRNFMNQGSHMQQHMMHHSPLTIPPIHQQHMMHHSPLTAPPMNNHSPLTLPYAVAAPMMFHGRESPVSFQQGWQGVEMVHQNPSQWTDFHGNTGSGWAQNNHSQPIQQVHHPPQGFANYPPQQGHWDNQGYNGYGNGSMGGSKQSEHAQSQFFNANNSDNRRTFNGQHNMPQQGQHYGQSQLSSSYLIPPDAGGMGRLQKIGKQHKQKGLSDGSTKYNTDNQDQLHPSFGKPHRGKKGNHKSNIDGSEQRELTENEHVVEEKRAELIETPLVRNMMKNFYRKFRLEEKESLEGAESYAMSCLGNPEFQPSVHWRIYLELADLSKRSNKFNRARELYSKVCELQPYASQGWSERSKLEEECGKLLDCSEILFDGLIYCPTNENLRTRAIKHEERMAYEFHNGDLSRARKLLEPTASMDIEKVWRTLLEGALMEARGGNIDIARNELRKLMKNVSWYGPLYLEAFRLERDCNLPERALVIVDEGLKEIPRYGPLWFGAFRICEGIDIQNGDLHLPRTFNYIDRAIKSISRELIWKVQMEAAQALERAAHIAITNEPIKAVGDLLTETRKRFAKTIFSCPENLCWKVWLAAGRMELSAGKFDEARRLFLKSFSVVPTKGRPSVLLECVRLEEFVGNIDLAKAILCKTRTEAKADWKVWLQSVSMEVRSGNRELAISLAQKGLMEHSGTGRLWATLIQLRQEDGEEQQMKALKKALHAVPKSGEVWCEAARIYLNPFSPSFDVDISSCYLDFATKFTPQYGDSFLEALRQEMVKTIISSSSHVKDTVSYLQNCPEEDILRKLVQAFDNAAATLITDKRSTNEVDKVIGELDTTKLELRCSNADPNYGKLWFHSRSRPSDTARKVLEQAKQVIWNDLREYSFIYILATMRQDTIKYCKTSNMNVNVPSLTELLNKTAWKEDNLLKRISKADFVTGFSEVNGEVDLQSLSLFDRRKFLFGSDLLLTWKPLN